MCIRDRFHALYYCDDDQKQIVNSVKEAFQEGAFLLETAADVFAEEIPLQVLDKRRKTFSALAEIDEEDMGVPVSYTHLKQATGQRIYVGTASGVIDDSAIHRAAKNTWKAVTGEKEMTFAAWAALILLDAKAAAYVAGAGAGSRSKAVDSCLLYTSRCV